MFDRNFIDECLFGMGDIEDIYGYIEFWHNHETGKSLEDFLGMTEYEYNAWIKNDDSVIRDILRSRADNVPFEEYQFMSDEEKIAARSYSIEEIEKMKNDDKHGN